MRLHDRFSLYLLFIFLPLFLFSSDEWQESLRYIRESREKVWQQVVELVLSEDRFPEEKNVEFISSSGKKISVTQSFARQLLSLNRFGRLRRTDGAFKGHHPVVRCKNLFFKSDVCLPALDPMMETAVFFFHGLLFQEGVVPSDFIFVKNVQSARLPSGTWDSSKIDSILIEKEEEFSLTNPQVLPHLEYESQNHLLQVSQAIEGERTTVFLFRSDRDRHPERH